MRLSTPSRRECLRVLGLGESATFKEVKQAYRRLARQHHPDRHGGSEEAEKRFVEIAIAYARLRAEFRITRFRERAIPPHEIRVMPTVVRPHWGRAWAKNFWTALMLLGAITVPAALLVFLLWGCWEQAPELALRRSKASDSPEALDQIFYDGLGPILGIGACSILLFMVIGYALMYPAKVRRLMRQILRS